MWIRGRYRIRIHISLQGGSQIRHKLWAVHEVAGIRKFVRVGLDARTESAARRPVEKCGVRFVALIPSLESPSRVSFNGSNLMVLFNEVRQDFKTVGHKNAMQNKLYGRILVFLRGEAPEGGLIVVHGADIT